MLVKMIKNNILFFCLFLSSDLISQKQNYFDKFIIDSQRHLSIFIDSNGKSRISHFDENHLLKNIDTIALHQNMKSYLFENPPIYWDVLDSFIFHIRLHVDKTGFVHTPLEKYDINSLLRLRNEYIYQSNTMIENAITPLDRDIFRIHFVSPTDTISHGPIYFDFFVTTDSFTLL